MIWRGVASPGFCPSLNGSSKMLLETTKVVIPCPVFAPRPTAPSSRISHPAPVAAPG